jgi:hypothetical protein
LSVKINIIHFFAIIKSQNTKGKAESGRERQKRKCTERLRGTERQKRKGKAEKEGNDITNRDRADEEGKG